MTFVLNPSAWRDWYRRLLPSYWVFLFVCTHLPKARLPGPADSDKAAHMLAFGLLAFCYWKFAETFGRPVSEQLVWHAVLVLTAYAAFDEYLQRFVGRSPSLEDWIADVCGIVAVLATLEFLRRRAAARRRGA
ncbi:MAG: VanZ family protein [Planctomycetota bacterium]|nr:MAG: VanZ family protein [Planctomycetota bacterium]